MPSESEPHLQAVDAGSQQGQPPVASPSKRAKSPNTPLWAWVVLLALLVCAWGWAVSYRESVSLRSDLAATKATLADARSDVEAHRAHFEMLRSQSEELAAQMEVLAAQTRLMAEAAGRAPAGPVATQPGLSESEQAAE